MATSNGRGAEGLPSTTKSAGLPSTTKSAGLPSTTKSVPRPKATSGTRDASGRQPSSHTTDTHRCGHCLARHRLSPFTAPKNDRLYEGQALGVRFADGTVRKLDERNIAHVTVESPHSAGRRILDFLPMSRAEIIEL